MTDKSLDELNDRTSTIRLLQTRRSSRPRDLVAPGPSSDEIELLLRIATRVPDHGKLTPWRFLVIEDREAFASLLAREYAQRNPSAGRVEKAANSNFAVQAPLLITAVFIPRHESHIPLSEQFLSMGAAIFNLQLGAIALGYGTGWVTGWAAHSSAVAKELSGQPATKVAGFIFIGTPNKPPAERARPLLRDVASHWPPR